MSFQANLKAKQFTLGTFQVILKTLKKQGKQLVFTNGCFDILHRGHVEYLCQARDLGDYLILGLNTDESVKRLGKSPERPINNEETRATILASLECVDAIIIFNDDTPLELISVIKPNILVKGSDYKVEDIVGFDEVKAIGGKIITINIVDGFSTTKLIEKLKG